LIGAVEQLRVVVTGASGMLGSNLVLDLARQGHEVIALYGRHPIAFDGIRSDACSLTDYAATECQLGAIRPSWIIHCAAATNVDWCETHPREAMRINGQVSWELASIARRIGSGLVFISTDAVFDGCSGGYRETDAIAPANAYGRCKAAAESGVLVELPDALILRTNFYGWSLQSKQSLAEWALGHLEAGEPVPGFCDVSFSPALVNDLSGWMLCLIRSRASGIFHVGCAEPCTKYEFLRQLAGVFQLRAGLVQPSELKQSALKAPRPHHSWLRVEKLAGVLGHDLPTLHEGLARFRKLRENGFLHRLKAAAA
jgi:dTDP-4-dehydrorhamnose reductase